MNPQTTERTAVASAGERWPALKAGQQHDWLSDGTAEISNAFTRAQRRLEQRLRWTLFKARLKVEDRLSRAYDARHNVETAKEEPLADCGVPAEDVERGNGVYRVTWGSLIHKSLSKLRIDHRRYTFLDYGAGKGKAMLMASDYPFRHIIGLEYSERLHAVAAANCRTYRSQTQKCRTLEPLHIDVLNYEPPPGPIVCFMCNPFDHATMQVVFDRWRARHDAGERDIRILYLNMRTIREMSPVLRNQHWLRPLAAGKRYVILGPSDAA